MQRPRISRRSILATTGAAATAAAIPGTAWAGAPRPGDPRPHGRPNILWLVSEDNNPYVGAYGDRLARTPTIDGLARDGVRYRNAFSVAPVCAPSRFAIVTGVCPESVGPAENMRADSTLPGFMKGFPEYLRQAGYYCTNNSKTDYNTTIDMAATWDASSGTAHWRDRPDGAPFFAVFNYLTTHESQLFNAPTGATDPAAVRVPAFLPDTPNVRNDRAHQYDRMAQMDAQLAARLAELDADGLTEDTIVFYYGDNGGVMPWSKRHAKDNGLRVPLVVRFPRKWAHLAPARAGSVLDAPVTLMDLGPTVLALAGVPVPDYVDGQVLAGLRRSRPAAYAFGGRTRMDERYDFVRTVSDGRLRYIRNYAPHRPYGQVNAYAWQLRSYQDWEQAHLDGTLDEVQERFWRERPAEELYDTHADPDGLHNLAGSPRHRADLNRLRRALDEHIFEVNDNGFIPEGSPVEGYANSRVPGAYPLRQVKALADKAIERKAANARHFLKELGADNYILRYWAAQGLLMLASRDCAAHRREIERRWDTEQSPHVKVVLSEILVKLGSQRPAVTWLTDTLDNHENARVRLQAVNALTYVGAAALPALPALDRAVAGSDQFLRNCGRYLGLVLRGEYTPQTRLFI
ncbi:sulfatase [Phytohabitans sp. ZYX-F-186]|uniref:Sulfatase n=1 Tax=Phytohabitans maris TaxID=3071409 RepID=A0ABU0Z9G1_9ACTN|nr:sulfatase [Phytohabitans sp. ZYX-F-186]MDQ7903691.1 sulfatase [Phytohabitans sp. ZYX-F-186]